MKRAILFLAVALSSAANMYSQTKSEEINGYLNAFEADSTVWKFSFGLNIPEITGTINEYVLYGDTVIYGKQWKILTIKNCFFNSVGMEGFGIKGLLRTEDKKIIFTSYPGFEECYWRGPQWEDFDPLIPKESVLCDFSWEDGDCRTEYEIVVADSIELNDRKNHKRIHFKPLSVSFYDYDNPYFHYGDLIEGLGPLMYDPFQRLFNAPIEIESPSLFLCCHVNGKLLYRNPVFSDCNGTYVSNETVDDITYKASVFFKGGQLRITFDYETLFDVELYNIKGMILLQRKNNRKEMLDNLDRLPKGIYVVRIISDNFVYSEKIVK
jgi:hypothetical protein